jgi:hypothetical protein
MLSVSENLLFLLEKCHKSMKSSKKKIKGFPDEGPQA